MQPSLSYEALEDAHTLWWRALRTVRVLQLVARSLRLLARNESICSIVVMLVWGILLVCLALIFVVGLSRKHDAKDRKSTRTLIVLGSGPY